jgi:hypothetical protein
MIKLISNILIVFYSIFARTLISPVGGLAGIFAILVSWHFNESVLWAIFHFSVGTMYLLYMLITGAFVDGAFMDIINSYL